MPTQTAVVLPGVPMPPPKPMMQEFKLSKLHNEIVAFANSNLQACESSHTEVQAIKTCLLQVVTKRWGSATAEM